MDKEMIGKYEACSLSGRPDGNRSDETLGVLGVTLLGRILYLL